jgi:hypothetical protein
MASGDAFLDDVGSPEALLRLLLQNAELREGFQELCRAGRIRAEGRKIAYTLTKLDDRHILTEPIDERYSAIPLEDWADLTLYDWNGELRLEGSNERFAPDRIIEQRGWASVHILGRDWRDFIRALQTPREPAKATPPISKSRSKPGVKPRRDLEDAVRALLEEGRNPREAGEPLKRFCEDVWKRCPGSLGEDGKPKRGYAESAIERALDRIQGR